MMTPATVRGMGAANDVVQTLPNGNRSVKLASGRTIVLDSKGNWVPPSWVCSLPFSGSLNPDCVTPTMMEMTEANGLTDIGASTSQSVADAIVAAQQQAAAQQCASYPESCAIASSNSPVAVSVAAAGQDITKPLTDLFTCGLFQSSQTQADGTTACAYSPTKIAIVAAIAVAALVALRR